MLGELILVILMLVDRLKYFNELDLGTGISQPCLESNGHLDGFQGKAYV
jgi:hypothetical protein